jgi:peroxiredoxin/Ca2+-binding EF-hand superfamily protein
MTARNSVLAIGTVTFGLIATAIIANAETKDGATPAANPLKERLVEQFRALDKNRDDRLTKAELGDGLFEQLNTDGDEFVTLPEAQAVIQKRGWEAILKASRNTTTKGLESGKKEPVKEASLRQGPRRLVPGDHSIGRMVPNLSLTDINDRKFSLSEYTDRQAIVIAFTNTTCPISKKYAPSLAAIERQYADRNVSFIYVNPTSSDKPAAIQAAIANQGFTGPYVRDIDGVVASALGATHTTDVFVLDAKRTIVYRGAVDDQYGFEYSLDAPRNEYLKLAINATLDRRPLLIAATQAPGCPLEAAEASPKSSEITYHNRVSRIIQSRCLECHREGGAGPFELQSYEDVAGQGAAIKQAVERNVMPPWFATRPEKGEVSHWSNDRSLAEQEKTDLLAWLNQGKPAGDEKDAPLPRQFPEGWRIGQPDHLVQLPKPMPVKATGVMGYQNVIVDAGITEDKWIRAMEIRPTAPQVVHHVLVFLLPPENLAKADADRAAGDDESGGFFAAYAPGGDPMICAEGFGTKIPAGSRLKFQLHYTPNGTATEDQTRLGINFTDKEPAHMLHVAGIANPRLSIPPGDENFPVTATQTVQADTTVLAFFPHMHLRGKSFKYEAIYPDGRRETLLDVPRYDFNWQLSYRLAEPLELPKGTTLELTGCFDNSKKNPANPDSTKTVKWGPQTYDEMMLGYIEYYTAEGADRPLSSIPNLDGLFKGLDRDKNGKLSEDELPAAWKERLLKLDTDGDKAVSLEEIQRGARRRR